jgi:hypothetical protein
VEEGVAGVRLRPDPVVEGVPLSLFLQLHSWDEAETSLCLTKNLRQGVSACVLLITSVNMG